MNTRLFVSVAATALIIGSGISFAQGPAGGPGAGGAGAAAPTERAAPAPGGGGGAERGAAPAAPMSRDTAEPRGGAAGPAGASSEPMQKGGANRNADTKTGKEMNRNADTKGGEPKAGDSKMGDTKAGDTKAGDTNRNAQTKDGADKSGAAQASGKPLTTEQRTKVTTVIKQQNVQPVTNINFSISVGTRVPRDVRFVPLPTEIITVYPDWRGYEFFLARGEIIVVNPRTLEIVAVLPA